MIIATACNRTFEFSTFGAEYELDSSLRWNDGVGVSTFFAGNHDPPQKFVAENSGEPEWAHDCNGNGAIGFPSRDSRFAIEWLWVERMRFGRRTISKAKCCFY